MPPENNMPNRLIREKSPYLLQHAHNPVDWYPWGEEAFAKAKAEDKPVFLSVGYSTCHWCHVMERESFEDPEVGALLGRDFVAIKVDREERPDVDALAMAACQALTGSGGWPTTVFMTPERKPFFAGTYFPRDNVGGRPGLMELLERVAALWRRDRRQVTGSGEALLDHLRQAQQEAASRQESLTDDTVAEAVRLLARSFDEQWGGFGGQPKFPTPHTLLFLLRYWKAAGDAAALSMAERTLEAMARGGIYDHVGFGFARYATDRRWLIPHFEKMLYDNGLLTLAYGEAFAATGRPLYRRVAREVADYILRDMTDGEGAFYAAEDADSEGAEGKYYLWSYPELRGALDAEEWERWTRYYPVTEAGNFEGVSILHRIGAPELPDEGSPEARALEDIRRRLLALRERRVRPFRDDKILSGWNGLMIAALAAAGRVLGEGRYAEAARRAAAFVTGRMVDGEGRLYTRYRDGHRSDRGFLDDYAYLVWGLLELFEAGGDPDWLERALALTGRMESEFAAPDGGYYLAAADGELPLRTRETYDSALPSGGAVVAMNLTRLARITGDPRWQRRAEALLKSVGGAAAQQPTGHVHWLSAFLTARTPGRQLILAGPPADSAAGEALRSLHERYLPFDTVVRWDGGTELARLIPFLKNIPVNDRSAAYLCEGGACRAPDEDLAAAVAAMT